jgi:cytochrome bd-type quinol oxidase subunit 2
LVIAGLATLSLPVLRRAVNRPLPIVQRSIAGFQIGCILNAWLWHQYAVLVRLKDGMPITIKDSPAPAATLPCKRWGIVLIVALMIINIIIAYLIYLYIVLKSDPHFGYEELD